MIKKIGLFVIVLISFFLLTGCTNGENMDSNTSTNLNEETGKVIKAKLDKDGNIVINEKIITDKILNISYEYDGVIIGLLAVRNGKGKAIVVVNTCQSCGGSPNAYFVQVGNQIKCKNCGNLFAIDDLDNLIKDGCNPIEIENRIDKNGKIIIGTEQLKNIKNKFVNWNGPKA